MESTQRCEKCNKCKGKNGKSRSGMQRYYCKGCKTYSQIAYLYEACYRNINQKIVSLLNEGCGIRSIARLLKIALNTVINRIKKIAKSITKPSVISMGKEYEMDEMRTYIGNKGNLYWIAYAIRRDTRDVTDFRVGRRTLKTLQSVVSTLLLSQAKKIYTDRYPLYSNLIPEQIHGRSKYSINFIERNNLNIRTHLKRLNRKTICFSKNLQMLEACLKIYFW
jgi:insertion element IS1 protein InsB